MRTDPHDKSSVVGFAIGDPACSLCAFKSKSVSLFKWADVGFNASHSRVSFALEWIGKVEHFAEQMVSCPDLLADVFNPVRNAVRISIREVYSFLTLSRVENTDCPTDVTLECLLRIGKSKV